MKQLRWLAFPVVLCVAATLAHGGGGEKEKKDKKGKLQGSWVAEKDGKKAEMTFKKDSWTLVFDGEKKFAGTYKTDPTKSPKELDMEIKEGDKYVGMTAKCIYEISGDMLKWCASEPGKEERPKGFPEKEGEEKTLYLIFKRVNK